MDGQRLHFFLLGLNNQNFIMEDRETGTWWQQVSGEAILGPLKGKRLKLIVADEVSFAIWKRENSNGQVMTLAAEFADRYLPSGWEVRFRMPRPGRKSDSEEILKPRDLVVGVSVAGRAKAYPLKDLREQNPVADSLGGTKVLLVVAPDGRSVRCFDVSVEEKPLDLYLKSGEESILLVDTQTGSEWDFAGQALSGPLQGRTLKRIPILREFWFDWKNYHPDTRVYTAGKLPGKTTP